MTTRVSDIQLRDFNPQGSEEWLTRAINYLKATLTLVRQRASGKVFNVTFRIVPKAVFNLLGESCV